MKVAIVNLSGNVGKTTLAAHLLAPRIKGKIHAVETVNETATEMGLEVEKGRAEKFVRLFKELLASQEAIVDVGASSAEDFLAQMVKVEGSHEEFDFFVVPTIPSGKVMRDTVRTLQLLEEIGVPPERIRVIFNKVQTDDVKEEFAPIFGYARSKGIKVKPEAAIEENEVFDLLSAKKTSIHAVLQDQTDYRKQLKEMGPDADRKQTSHAIDMHALKALSRGVQRQFDRAYDALFAA